MAAMQEHADALRVRKYAGVPSLDERPSWWQSPLFCGWGAQCNLASKRAGKAPDFATQENYELFLAELDKHGSDPGDVVIDDKWQLNYGENSVDLQNRPDLGGFIRKQHDRGRRVLLWLKFWDPEGVLVEECITNANGGVVSTDPHKSRIYKSDSRNQSEACFLLKVWMQMASKWISAPAFQVDQECIFTKTSGDWS